MDNLFLISVDHFFC